MGRMKELLDQRLEESKWEMYEVLQSLRDRQVLPPFSDQAVKMLLDRIEKLEVPDVGKE